MTTIERSQEGFTVFLASTMPFADPVCRSWISQADLVVLSNREIEASFLGVFGNDEGVRAVVQPNSLAGQVAFHVKQVTKHRSIVIFHECCWPTLDLAICLVRPRGALVPIVSLEGFSELDSRRAVVSWLRMNRSDSRFGQRLRNVAFLILLWPFFRFLVEDTGPDVPHRLNVKARYWTHSSLTALDLSESPQEVTEQGTSTIPDRSFLHPPMSQPVVVDVMVVLGTEPMPHADLRYFYGRLFDELVASGVSVGVKSHPRKSEAVEWRSLLSSTSETRFIELQSEVPAEVLVGRMGIPIVIGIASTALALAPARCFSLVDLAFCDAESRERRRKHLSNVRGLRDGEGYLTFLQSWVELRTVLQGNTVEE